MKHKPKTQKTMTTPASTTGNNNDLFDVRRIRRLVELMRENDLSEIDLQQGETRMQLRRTPTVAPVVQTGHPHFTPYPIHSIPAVPAAPQPLVAAVSDTKTTAEEAKFVVIKSPMVGTFYTASKPEQSPFVKIGDSVQPETTVCLVEAMKVFNEIAAETTGKIVAVLVKNGELVEFGKPLFKVAPA